MRISEGERKVMNAVWECDGITASQIAAKLGDQGWSKTTTYTMISVCIEKGYLRRENPHFHCHAQLTREDAAAMELDALIDNGFGGSTDLLLAALVGRKRLSKEQLSKLNDMVQSMED